jgi:hypothetical protein
MERLEKVAMPFTGATDLVPESVPLAALLPMDATTLSVAPVTRLPLASCTATVTAGEMAAPAVVFVGCCTMASLAATPTCVVMLPLVPVRERESVAVTVCVTPAVVLVVKSTVAAPAESVTEVAEAKEPPLVLVQLITVPSAATGLLSASTVCAVMVTGEPAATVEALEVTTYPVAAPAVKVTRAVSRSATPFSVPITSTRPTAELVRIAV